MNSPRKTFTKRVLSGALLLALLGGCTNSVGTNSEIQQGPVGIGRGIDELKGAPCACLEIEMKIPGEYQV